MQVSKKEQSENMFKSVVFSNPILHFLSKIEENPKDVRKRKLIGEQKKIKYLPKSYFFNYHYKGIKSCSNSIITTLKFTTYNIKI